MTHIEPKLALFQEVGVGQGLVRIQPRRVCRRYWLQTGRAGDRALRPNPAADVALALAASPVKKVPQDIIGDAPDVADDPVELRLLHLFCADD